MAWRKSWAKQNIYGIDGKGKCSKRLLQPDERSVWDDYLDMAELSPIRGKVCIADDIGYTQEQLSQILQTPIKIIDRAEKQLLKFKMIEINKNRVISLRNWQHYQSEYSRQLQYRVTSVSNSDRLLQERDRERDRERDIDIDNKYIYIPASQFLIVKTSFLEKIKTIYDYLDLPSEFKRIEGWLLTHQIRAKQIKSWERFIINWLNKIDKPVPKLSKPISTYTPPDQKERWQAKPPKKFTKLLDKTIQEMGKNKGV